MYRFLVLASGRGSNFLSIIKAIENKDIRNANIIGLITDRPDTGAEEHAKAYHIPVFVLNYQNYKNKIDFHQDLLETAISLNPDLIIGAGFMRVLSKDFVKTFPNKIMNIHPSLLPSFPGMHAQKQAIEYGVKVSGCTVHFIDEGIDTGPIILQKAVEVPEGATEEELANLILKEEHKLYIKALQLFCDNKLEVIESPNQLRKIVRIKS